jgi:hypothetical protein
MNCPLKLSTAILFAIFSVAPVFAQAEKLELIIGPQRPPPPPLNECPAVGLDLPQEPIFDGEWRGLVVHINGGDPKVIPVYRWSISAGTVLAGTDTRNLIIDTTGASAVGEITVTVDVGGYQPKCPQTQGIVTLTVNRTLNCEQTVRALIRCYRDPLNADRRHLLLRRMTSVDPRVAVVFGEALTDESNVTVRVAAAEMLEKFFIRKPVAMGGTEELLLRTQDWWLENRERLIKEAKEKQEEEDGQRRVR